ncbi:hypothetical protein DMENIID0001_046130 [Sergentomyia squamirostris]
MRLMLIVLSVLLAVCGAEESVKKNTTETTKSSRKGKELRDKRTLNKFGNYDDLTPAFFTYPRVLERRLGSAPPDGRTTFLSSLQERKYDGGYNNVPSFNYQPHYEPEATNFISGHSYATHPQYLEAPEPIIEIIIKDSNETLPAPAPLVLPRQKKKKEQVQVFYVKYKKDGHKGVIIDQPVPALSPSAYHQERHGHEDEEELHEEPLIVTLPPPLKTTTLRTIIHPESEKFHSNSGIHVSFNTEDKSQAGHQVQEERVESVVKPIIALPRSVNFSPQQSNVQATEFRQRYVHQARNFGGDQFNYPQANLHQGLVSPTLQLPLQNTPSQQFRSPGQNYHQAPPSQYFNSHHRYNIQQHHQHHHHQEQHPPPLHYQENHQEPPRHTGPPQPHFVPTPSSFGPPPPPFRPVPTSHYQQRPQSQPTFFQPPPPPPPSSQHQHQSHQQNQATHQHPPPPPHQQQIRFPGPQAPSPQPPPSSQNNHYQPLKYRPHPQPQRPIPIPIHQFSQPPQAQPQFRPPQHSSQPQHHQPQQYHHVPPHPPQPQQPPQSHVNQQISFTPPPQGSIQGGGLIQQQAPNLSREPQFQQNTHQHHQPIPNQDILQSFTPDGSDLKLIPSVAKYEQHIVEHVPTVNQYISTSQSQLSVHQQQQQQHQQQQLFFTQTSPVPPQEPSRQHRPNIGPLANEIGHLSTVHPLEPVTPSPQPGFHQSTQTPAQTFIQQQISHLLRDPPPRQNHLQPNLQPQIIPNSHPTFQDSRPAPGQSVSTVHSEVFPIFEQEQQRFYNKQPVAEQEQNQLQTVSIAGRHGVANPISSTTLSTSSTYEPTTQRTSSTIQEVSSTTQKTANKPPPNIILPDEVPDDLREQLLSSGILDNADISVLDYDKLGETALENLPPEHLANFFNAGGASQISSSNRVEVFANPDKEKRSKLDEATPALSDKENVDLRVVRFDAASQKSISDKYIKEDSTVLPSVDINDHQYNRYLPLKINGVHFPIPIELLGKKISSVVVLAPVDNLQTVEDPEDGRFERDVIDAKQVRFLAGDALKQLIKKPSHENFKKWLDKEATTDIEFQSVVLLVTRNPENETDREIFMYDIPSKTVNRLSGELSSSFVNIAEANAATDNIDKATVVDSGIFQKMDSSGKSAEDSTEDYPITSSQSDQVDPMDSAASEIVESRADPDDPTFNVDETPLDTHVVISSGYSVIKS